MESEGIDRSSSIICFSWMKIDAFDVSESKRHLFAVVSPRILSMSM